MAQNQGLSTFTGGTGSKTLTIGMTATWMEIHFGGTGIRHSVGYISGGNQHCYPDDTSAVVAGKAIQVKDTSGALLLEGTWTSFTGSTVIFNITTAPTTMPQMLLRFGN